MRPRGTTLLSGRRSLALVVLCACSSTTPVVVPTITPSPTVHPSPSPIPATFSSARALTTIRELAALGPREAVSTTYARAAELVARRFRGLGYRVRTQRFPVRGGSVDGISVAAGATRNVIAEPQAFDPASPFVVVGSHLDTVPDSPGANDNASGIAVMLELARVTQIEAPVLPVVFVAFGAEERRRQSRSQSEYAVGSSVYLSSLTEMQRRNVRAGVVLDMIGAGSRVRILGRGDVKERALILAKRLKIPAAFETTFLYSDHLPFEQRGIPVVWFWGGDHPDFHSPRDKPSVIERAELARVGAVAWATLQDLP